MSQVNELSTATLTIAFLDVDGDPAAPTGVTYTVHDAGSATELRASTAVSPASSVAIKLTPADNAILGGSFSDQWRTVTVVATYGVDDQLTSEIVYTVRNLRFLT